MWVSIEGSIGAGKSTTAKFVADRLGWGVAHEETTKHPFLADFYNDPGRYAIETEIGFILLHYHQLKLLPTDENFVADFSPGKDLVFARMNLRASELELFEQVYAALPGAMGKPALAVFIDLPLGVLQQRIADRGRPYEIGVTANYLLSLRSHYLENLHELGERVETLRLTGAESRDAVAAQVHDIVRQALFGESRLL
jgi:deoxyguanosine kinase